MSTSQVSRRLSLIRSAVNNVLNQFGRPEPLSLVEWANENFYLSSESSYLEGRWETLPFQIAPLNAIGHEDIREVNFLKSARVGYSQMIRAAVGYFVEHKSRNQILYQPGDTQASSFMKSNVETMIRDVPVVKALAPWIGKKHRDNTLEAKRFSNGKQLWVLGGTAARNYREKSVDAVYYDELAGFDHDIEKEGDPLTLGDKRIEGSVFPKSVRGSTPKVAGTCMITRAASTAECFFRFHLACPHCGREQHLKWGGKGAEFGFKWLDDDPTTVAYACEHCACLSGQQDMVEQQQTGRWICEKSGTWTRDGLSYFDKDDKRADTPESVAFHIWTAYSPFTTWQQIVKDWIKAQGDLSKLKTFVNTTLGEAWEETGDEIEPGSLFMRREHYRAEVPVDDCILTAAVDVQDDRLEVQIEGWGAGEENWKVSYERLYGDLSRSEIWDVLAKRLGRSFTTPSGLMVNIRLAVIDSGGHYTDEVYAFSRQQGARRVIPIKGHSVTGKPVADFPRQKNKKHVYLTMLGVDSAKEIITARLQIADPGEGYTHFPVSQQFDQTYFDHLTNERKVTTFEKGRRVIKWVAKGRQEPFDLSVYNLAAIRILQQHMGIKLNELKPFKVSADNSPAERRKSDYWG